MGHLDEEAGIHTEGIFLQRLKDSLAFQTAPNIKMLGIIIDTQCGFHAHVGDVTEKAHVRRSVTSRIARFHWGLEAGFLKSAHAA